MTQITLIVKKKRDIRKMRPYLQNNDNNHKNSNHNSNIYYNKIIQKPYKFILPLYDFVWFLYDFIIVNIRIMIRILMIIIIILEVGPHFSNVPFLFDY
jgi:hypothetical protein